jgi:hypothetical protein
LRCREWVFYRRRLTEAGVRTAFVSLVAAEESLLAPSRGRVFTDGERRRILEMLDQGYSDRRFADLIVRTDVGGVEEALASLIAGLRRSGILGARGPGH